MRISIQQNEDAAVIKLDGRVAGAWAEELGRFWAETAQSLKAKKLSLDLRDVTYTDAFGKQVLREICSESGAEIVFSTPWAQYLAETVSSRHPQPNLKEPGHAE